MYLWEGQEEVGGARGGGWVHPKGENSAASLDFAVERPWFHKWIEKRAISPPRVSFPSFKANLPGLHSPRALIQCLFVWWYGYSISIG